MFALLLSGVAAGQSSPPIALQTVEIRSGPLQLKAFLWTPAGPGPFPAVLFNHGSGGADPEHTAGLTMKEAAERLGPLFVRHGYAFLYLFRRGQGLSAEQGPFIQDLLQREKAAHGDEARKHLQYILLTTDHLDDVLAALSFLKTVHAVDPHRIAIAGHSFGGQLTLLAAERDPAVRAAVTFAAAAGSWEATPELRDRLLTAVRKTATPILLIQAANDYSTAAGRDLAADLERQHKPYALKIYPPVGQTREEGHNLVYNAVPQWESDVFRFLDEYVRPGHKKEPDRP